MTIQVLSHRHHGQVNQPKGLQQGFRRRAAGGDDVDMLTYGSRGQQRTAALSAKFGELAFIRAVTSEEPILLLDDVFGELDPARREYLLDQALQHEQALITTTDYSSISEEILATAHRFQVVAGEINHTHF